MLRYLLDTKLCVRVLRYRPEALRRRFAEEEGRLCISTIVLMELLHGAAKSNRPSDHRREIEVFSGLVPVLDFDADAAEHAADIRTVLSRQGKTIGAYDLLIAGHARNRALTLVTGNLGEFCRVEGLRCEDWPAGEAAH